MRVIDLRAQAVTVDAREGVLAVVEGDGVLKLVRTRYPKLVVEELRSFSGRRCLVLAKALDTYLMSFDNALFVSRDLVDWRRVLEVRAGNTLWHVCGTPQGIIVQEYGEPPTSLWISSNGYRWSRLLTNLDIDPSSRHFHDIAYDGYRDVVHATLGDGNLVRAVAIYDHSFEHLYKGPWQFVPIVVLKHMVVFGFDSGIARGGIGIFYPEDKKWGFIFLKWVDESVKHFQMCDLKLLSNGVWIAALGSPRAIAASRDLMRWFPIYVESLDKEFNHHMRVEEYGDSVVCCTGKKLLFLNGTEIENTLMSTPIIVPYRALIDKVKGAVFMLKRMR